MDEISEITNGTVNRITIASEMKQYIKPSIKTREIHVHQIIALSPGGTIGFNNGGNDDGNADNALGHGRRGTWGNLWYDGSEE